MPDICLSGKVVVVHITIAITFIIRMAVLSLFSMDSYSNRKGRGKKRINFRYTALHYLMFLLSFPNILYCVIFITRVKRLQELKHCK